MFVCVYVKGVCVCLSVCLSFFQCKNGKTKKDGGQVGIKPAAAAIFGGSDENRPCFAYLKCMCFSDLCFSDACVSLSVFELRGVEDEEATKATVEDLTVEEYSKFS